MYDEAGRHWLWVFAGQNTVVFLAAATRSGKVMRGHLAPRGDVDEGLGRTLISDFFGAYNAMAQMGFTLAGCWVHARRPVLRVAQAVSGLGDWGAAWQGRIAELYRLHRVWLAEQVGTPAYEAARTQVSAHVEAIRRTLLADLTDPNLPAQARKALSLRTKGWPRLTRFLEDPNIPVDNNTAERCLRTPVVGRKNFYDSGTSWSAELAAITFSIAETAKKNGVEPLHFLQQYLGVCAEDGGKTAARRGPRPLPLLAEAPCPARRGHLLSTVRYCGRLFRLLAGRATYPPRAAIARVLCEALGWRRKSGRLKDMSARQALLRMQSDGLIVLPSSTITHANVPKPLAFTAASDPRDPITGSRRDLGDLRLELVLRRKDMHVWRELIARYHYLGYTPLTGAHMHYLIYDGDQLLGAIGLGASAWKLAPRDRFIGWTPAQREQNLHLIVNNARFLLLPWVHVRYLASSVLALAARRMQQDWIERHNYRPLLLKLRDKPVKAIFLYPLAKDFRSQLTAPQA